MSTDKPRALLAEDEAHLRDELKSALQLLWPELQIVAEAADGVAAAQALALHKPDIAFLDVRMPGLSGIDVAALAAHRCHVVFLTAYNDYAVDAFDHGAVDYLLKPLDVARLAVTLARLREKLDQAPANLSGMTGKKTAQPLRWIQASVGSQIRFIDIDDVLCFRADAKYTRVVTHKFEGHIRTTIKDLALQLDEEKFWQISRSAIVNVAAIDLVQRIDNGLALRLTHSDEWQNVSQAYQFRFRQM